MLTKRELQKIFYKIENRVPFIPDFSDFWNILKIIFITLLISVIHSFSMIDKSSEFYNQFWFVLKNFYQYIFVFLIFLFTFSKIITSIKPIKSIILICSLSFITIYLVESIKIRELYNLIENFDSISRKFSISFGLLFFFLMYFDWREKNINPIQVQAQLSFLQSKMRPHFLFNTLNSIISLLKKDPILAKKMILNLSELLRASLKDNEEFLHTIKEEYNLCEKYLEIEKIRLGDRLKVNWEVEEHIYKSLIPKLSIQPLVENSILHGIQKLEYGGTINISIKEKDLNIYIYIENPIETNENSVLIEESQHNNISMDNLKERLNICFDGDISFSRENIDDKFIVKLRIPFKNKK